MASIEELTTLVTPPPVPRLAPGDWDACDSVLGFVTPSDYRVVIDTYGAGIFGGFVWFMLPQSNMKRLNMLTEMSAQRNVLREMGEFEEVPYDIESLIPCGATNNGDTVFWWTNGAADSTRWTIVVHSGRDPQWSAYRGNLLGFLTDIFSGRYKCEVFPEGFPSGSDFYFSPIGETSD